MMKKVWPVLLAVVLVFGLALLGCGSKSGDPPPESKPFSFEGPWDGIIKPWGTDAPTITGNEIAIPGGTSTGFYIGFNDIGYTYNRGDILIITYEIVEITTPAAVITFKSAKGSTLTDVNQSNSAWGIGNGREYVLGDAAKSVYDGPKVKGTYDAATKTGTFELLMHLINGDGIGFQHNAWAEFDGVKVAENSKYTFKITKIENAVAEDIPEPPAPPAEGEGYDDTTGMVEGIGVQGDGTLNTTTGEMALGKGAVGGSSLFTIELAAPTSATGTKTIKIKYICKEVVPSAKITLKQGGWSDAPSNIGSVNQYPSLTPDVKSVLEIPENIYANGTTTLYFQFNDYENNDAEVYLKIISVTVE
jgi:hypothetical protein